MKKILILAAASLLALGATAGENYGRIGVGYDKWHQSSKYMNGSDYNGFYVDWTFVGIPVVENLPLCVEAGIRFNYEYNKSEVNKTDYKTTFMTVGIPVNLTYRFEIANSGVRISPYAGINFKVHALGEQKYTVEEPHTTTIGAGTRFETTTTSTIKSKKTINIFDKDKNGGIKYNRFQMGWQVGVNLEFKKFYVSFGYGTDFIKIAENINTSNLTVGIGFSY